MIAAVLAAEATGLPLESVADATGVLSLAWLIPVVPALSAALLLVVGKRLGTAAAWIAIGAVGVSAVLSTLVLLALAGQPAGERVVVQQVATWLQAGDLQVDWAVLLDPLSTTMIMLVTWVGLLIHVYSLGYMHGDPRFGRFFAYLNLFVASMLVLVLGSSFLVVFVGWELVGLCSYLLIGFWFERRDYAGAAKKAFVVNRVGDVGFMIAMFIVFATFGTLSFTEVIPQAPTLATGTAVAITLLLLLAATGKSAQIPLYVWLPDAMAGPTPVSALIHAATMVTAGVFLVARTSAIFAQVPEVGLVVAAVGATTALVAAIIACAQIDLKRVLAYSTVSQLGYMFIGVGIGDSVAGVFHLLTHGFFKALLFLAAGSVMHALADETDMRRMGGLWRIMPITAGTSAIAVLSIAGIPLLSGYYSKEEILASAAVDSLTGFVIWIVGIVTAGLTAFYMTRWFWLTFMGGQRWRHTTHPTVETEEMDAQAQGVAGEPAERELHPHESPPTMWVPLVVLAVASVFGGVLNLNPETGLLHEWLVGPSVVPFEGEVSYLADVWKIVIAVAAGIIGILVAVLMYRGIDIETVGAGGGPRRAARNAFGVDRFYELTVLRPGQALSRGFVAFDTQGVDGAVNGAGAATQALAQVGRRVQTGFVRNYALILLGGAVLVVALLWGGGQL